MLNDARLATLREEVGAEVLLDVLELFFEEAESTLDNLDRAAPAERAELAHSLRGSAATLGFDGLAAMAAAIEGAAGRATNSGPAPPNAAAVRRHLNLIRRTLPAKVAAPCPAAPAERALLRQQA
jgi:HPt (histidine-containing phosphotransfer) domain-containing protein